MLPVKNLGRFGKIAIGWGVITAIGVYGFVLSKNSIDNKRYESMQIRDRMRKSNYGEYTPSQRRFDA